MDLFDLMQHVNLRLNHGLICNLCRTKMFLQHLFLCTLDTSIDIISHVIEVE